MYNTVNRSQIFVLDQDEARHFYVDVLGFMRWLTVRVPGDDSREILLEQPGPPAMDEATALQVRELVTKSDGRMAVFDHRRRTGCVRDARSPRVDVTGEPSPKPYGIDFGIRDPFGHAIRIGQMLKGVIR